MLRLEELVEGKARLEEEFRSGSSILFAAEYVSGLLYQLSRAPVESNLAVQTLLADRITTDPTINPVMQHQCIVQLFTAFRLIQCRSVDIVERIITIMGKAETESFTKEQLSNIIFNEILIGAGVIPEQEGSHAEQ
jgi:hypothetical protein